MAYATIETITAWSAPAWADDRIVDEAMVEHSRLIGEVPTFLGDESPITVMVMQRDEVDLGADPVSFSRLPPEVRIAGVRLSAAQAQELGRLLEAGVSLAFANGGQQAENRDRQTETASGDAVDQTRSKLAE
jgi:hypothetical protein